MDAVAKERAAELLEEANLAWDLRSDPEQAKAAIDALKAATDIDPTNAEAYADLSHALYFYADCHLRWDESSAELYKTAHEEGVTYAEKALSTISPDFAETMARGTPMEDTSTVPRDEAVYWLTSGQEALDLLDASAVPALYWRAANLGRWASQESFATILKYKDEVRAMMEFCLATEPAYWYQGPDRYFGVFYARLSGGFAGGDMRKSAEHFRSSLLAEPDYWSTRILMAKEWAIKDGDKELYEELIDYVLAGDPEVIPYIKPENECEQRKAAELKAQIDEFFPPESRDRKNGSGESKSRHSKGTRTDS